MLKGLIGKKIGMTQIFDDGGTAIPVTLIEAGPCYVTQVRTIDNDGYSSVQLGFEEIKPKRLTGGQLGHLKRNNVPPLRFLREFREKNPEVNEGQTVTVKDIFTVGDQVDIVGTSKGKGFQGTVKRYHFHGGLRATVSRIASEPPAHAAPRPHRDASLKGHAVLDIWASTASLPKT